MVSEVNKNKTQSVAQFQLHVRQLFLHLPLRIANVPTQVVGGGFTFIKKVVVSPTPFTLPTLFLLEGGISGCAGNQLTS